MSQHKERAEKNCLNCGTNTVGHYCHNCGQENIEPKEKFFQLLRHFFEDLTHFDGKLFSTVVPLFKKPEFLTAEYTAGRRAMYLNPIRMYIFISAVFFLLVMTVFMRKENDPPKKSDLKTFGNGMVAIGEKLQKVGTELDDTLSISTDNAKFIFQGKKETVAHYDSVQAMLSDSLKDGIVESYFMRKLIASIEHYQNNQKELKHVARAKFFHTLPYMFFASVPFVALILSLLYFRRKQFYYVSHIIFVIHFYCIIFLLSILGLVLEGFGDIGYTLAVVLRLSSFLYLYLAMCRFYQQSKFITFLKLLIFGATSITVIFIFTALVALYTFISL